MAGPYRLDLDFLPPSVNELYGQRSDGGKYLTEYGVFRREQIRDAARLAGLEPSTKKRYGVVAVLYMPDWDGLDVDNGLKALLDGALSTRTDQRVIHLLIDKRVAPHYAPRTKVEVWEIKGDGGIVAWLRLVMGLDDEEDTIEVGERAIPYRRTERRPA